MNYDKIREEFYKGHSEEEMQDILYKLKTEPIANPDVISDIGVNTTPILSTWIDDLLYKAKRINNTMSPDEALHSDECLDKIFAYIKTKPKFFTGNDVNNLKAYFRNSQTSVVNATKVANFSPIAARKVYEKYCPKFYATILDYSCVDDETEYFNGYEWKSLKDYTPEDKVLQYNEDGTSTLVKPLNYIHYKNNEPFYEYKGRAFNTCLTGDHNIVYRKRINQTSELSNKCFFIKQSDILNTNFRGRIPTAYTYNGDLNVKESLLRLAVAVQADGIMNTRNFKRKDNWIYARFSKERKIERFKNLLESNNIEYNLDEDTYDSINNTGYKNRWEFSFKCPELYEIFKDKSKTFPKEWYNLSLTCKNIIIDEIFNWDGYNKTYSTTNEDNAEFIYYVFSSTNHTATYSVDIRKNSPNLKPCYYVYCGSNITTAYTRYKSDFEIVNKEDKYCFTVPSHMLVLRRNKQVFITGNCGWGARMLGCLSSPYEYKYVGIEPNSKLNERLKEFSEWICKSLHRENNTVLYLEGSEVFHEELVNTVDLSFSSPPYFNLEIYCNEETQSANENTTFKAWVEHYMIPTIKNIYKYTKVGGLHIVNLKNLSTAGKEPLLDVWIKCCIAAGFTLIEGDYLVHQSRRQFDKGKTNVNFMGDKEPIIIFKKVS